MRFIDVGIVGVRLLSHLRVNDRLTLVVVIGGEVVLVSEHVFLLYGVLNYLGVNDELLVIKWTLLITLIHRLILRVLRSLFKVLLFILVLHLVLVKQRELKLLSL